MNRQRRLEAIAKRRAIIDSHLHMLSNSNQHEVRVPNIIRSRNGRTRERFKNDLPQQQEKLMLQKNLDSDSVQASAACGMTPASENGSNQGLVPVEISEKIASIVASNNGDILKSFQTIQTEDGTVMVVLEDDAVAACNEDNKMQGNRGVNIANTSVTTYVQSEPLEVSQHHRDNLLEVQQETEECYIIVQSEDGNHILLQSSSSINSQTLGQNPLEGSYLKASEMQGKEGLAKVTKTAFDSCVTHTIRQTKTSGVSSSRKAPKSSTISNQNKKLSQIKAKSAPKKPKLGVKVKNNEKISSNLLMNTVNIGVDADMKKMLNGDKHHEKPRPFRFELPPEMEQEDLATDLRDNFMTVPVPIKIESIRSKTEAGTFKAKAVNIKDSVLSCSRCPETFARPLDLLQHVKLAHTNASSTGNGKEFDLYPKSEIIDLSLSLGSNDNSQLAPEFPTVTVTSHCVQSEPTTSLIPQESSCMQNTFSTSSNVYAIQTEDGGTVFVQIADENSLRFTEGNHEEINNAIQIDHNLNHSVLEIHQNQKQTLNVNEGSLQNSTLNDCVEEGSVILKPDARILTSGTTTGNESTMVEADASDDNVWVVQNVHTLSPDPFSHNYVVNNDGNTITIQSASDNSRDVDVIDHETREQELGVHLKNIFQDTKPDILFLSQQ